MAKTSCLLLSLLVLYYVADPTLANSSGPVSYAGHKVIAALPRTEEHVILLKKLRSDYGVDLWNEPQLQNASVMMHLSPQMSEHVSRAFHEKGMEYFVAFNDLQRTIDEEKVFHAPTQKAAAYFDFGKYHQLSELVKLMQDLASQYSNIATLEEVKKTFENRPIHVLKITSGAKGTKPVILMECGIHAREWTSVAAGAYLIDKLITQYGTDSQVTSLLDKYEFQIVPQANPDGYVYTWTVDRMWRKNRSKSRTDWMGLCRGVDPNRNFDVEHCGVGTSRRPCDDIFCGDAPFSESESSALRDLMVNAGRRMKSYISIHAFSQLWMTPYGTTKQLPPTYQELVRIGTIGANALQKRHGTQFRVGSIANIIYEAAGSSADYAYVKQNVAISYALELRDKGRFGFFLPANQILPACEETADGVLAAIAAM